MKTTLDIPDDVLKDAMRFTAAKTKREALVTAVEDYNRRQRLRLLADELGDFEGFLSAEELRDVRDLDILS